MRWFPEDLASLREGLARLGLGRDFNALVARLERRGLIVRLSGAFGGAGGAVVRSWG